jgi:hypothetical protein
MKHWIVFAVAMGVAVPAGAEMWKCTDRDGNTRYTNVKAEATGCTALNLEPMNTAKPPAARTQQPAPVSFPSVDSATQRQRDAGRRKILEQELAQEQQELTSAQKALAEQKEIRLGSERNYARVEERLAPYEDRVKQHQANVDSLRRELATIK